MKQILFLFRDHLLTFLKKTNQVQSKCDLWETDPEYDF